MRTVFVAYLATMLVGLALMFVLAVRHV